MRKVFLKRKRSNEVVKKSQELNLRRPKTKMFKNLKPKTSNYK
jgi:hypothetical protein